MSTRPPMATTEVRSGGLNPFPEIARRSPAQQDSLRTGAAREQLVQDKKDRREARIAELQHGDPELHEPRVQRAQAEKLASMEEREEEGMSTGAKVGLSVAGAAVVGGILMHRRGPIKAGMRALKSRSAGKQATELSESLSRAKVNEVAFKAERKLTPDARDVNGRAMDKKLKPRFAAQDADNARYDKLQGSQVKAHEAASQQKASGSGKTSAAQKEALDQKVAAATKAGAKVRMSSKKNAPRIAGAQPTTTMAASEMEAAVARGKQQNAGFAAQSKARAQGLADTKASLAQANEANAGKLRAERSKPLPQEDPSKLAGLLPKYSSKTGSRLAVQSTRKAATQKTGIKMQSKKAESKAQTRARVSKTFREGAPRQD